MNMSNGMGQVGADLVAARERAALADQKDVLRLVNEIKETADKLLRDQADRGDIKLLARAIRELRYSFKLLAKFNDRPKVTVFGSARTPQGTAVYAHAEAFGRAIAKAGYMVITGGGPGVMEAGHRGAGVQESIGINILLPFEQHANPIIAGDEKLLNLKYFFTRKLLFIKEAEALVLFPGGFGTFDEGFEVLTLIQTGKAKMMPVVMVDVPGGEFWADWKKYIDKHLRDTGMISPEDESLFRITTSIDEAVEEITKFYRVYHSMRYVRGDLVLRLKRPISDKLFSCLDREFGDILEGAGAKFRRGEALEDEANDHDAHGLTRLMFPFNRKALGRLRQLIDRINAD